MKSPKKTYESDAEFNASELLPLVGQTLINVLYEGGFAVLVFAPDTPGAQPTYAQVQCDAEDTGPGVLMVSR